MTTDPKPAETSWILDLRVQGAIALAISIVLPLLLHWLKRKRESDKTKSCNSTSNMTQAGSGVQIGAISGGEVNIYTGPTPEEQKSTQLRIEALLSENAVLERRNAMLAAELELDADIVNSFFTQLGAGDIPRERWAYALADLAFSYKRLVAALSSISTDDAEVQAKRKLARSAVESGEYSRADSLLSECEDLNLEAANQSAEVAKSNQIQAAENRANRGHIAILQFNYPKAATHFRYAADQVKDLDSRLHFQFLDSLRYVLYRHGLEKGSYGSFEDSIDVCKEIIATFPSDSFPSIWAKAQRDLGTAFSDLGELKGKAGTQLLEKSVEIFLELLARISKEAEPLLWGHVQNNLGSSYRALFERSGQNDMLCKAIAAYNDAMTTLTKEKAPQDWAFVQSNLANLYRIQGEHEEDGEASFRRAVEACQNALQIIKHENAPDDWANVNNNLGNAQGSIGSIDGDLQAFKEAEASYLKALKVWTQERFPLRWASVHNNLGVIYRAMGMSEQGTQHFENAVTEFQEALREYTIKYTPLDWAMTQYNLGTALLWIGTRIRSTEKLNEASIATRKALDVWRTEKQEAYAKKADSQLKIIGQMIQRLG